MSDASNVFWAAFGGGAAAGLFTMVAIGFAEWLRWYVDRPLLRVSGSLGLVMDPLANEVVEKLSIGARNVHSKPITVSSFGLDYKKRKLGTLWIKPTTGLTYPYEIEGGKAITELPDLTSLVKTLMDAGHRPSDLRGVWFDASTGVRYRGKMRKNVIRKFEELAATNVSNS